MEFTEKQRKLEVLVASVLGGRSKCRRISKRVLTGDTLRAELIAPPPDSGPGVFVRLAGDIVACYDHDHDDPKMRVYYIAQSLACEGWDAGWY